jgi:hypothetical protein
MPESGKKRKRDKKGAARLVQQRNATDAPTDVTGSKLGLENIFLLDQPKL